MLGLSMELVFVRTLHGGCLCEDSSGRLSLLGLSREVVFC